ncbi:MAG: hypothetical protein IKL27_01010 [Oscillospiraceae bacterium]|nr:hypothetical protein [Oscillospiraceae bacterium]
MKNRIRLIAVVCVLALLLSGCNAMFDKVYRSEEVYVDEYFEIKGETFVQEVKNYRGMKNALMNLINSAATYGKIRTEKYKGDPEDDISKVCFEVTREEPMGIYAVDYITHSVNLIVSYYEIEVYITYRRTPEEITGVVTIRSGTELQNLLSTAMEKCDDSLAVMQVSTDVDEESIENYVKSIYRSNPVRVPVCPEVTVNSYTAPDNTIQEITEIELEYPAGKEEIGEMCTSLQSYTRDVITMSNYGDVNHVCRTIANSCRPAADGSSSAYEALLGSGTANSEGYAMTAKVLCNAAGIDSYVVEGWLGDVKHFWNIVNIRGHLYHLDLYSAAVSGEDAEFMLDNDIESRYSWDRAAYPVCEDPNNDNE